MFKKNTLSTPNCHIILIFATIMSIRNSISILILFLLCCIMPMQGKDFIVVIDAGHGGKDIGAPGIKSYEKNINLAVAKKLGSKLKALGVNVIRLNTESQFYDTMRRPYYARDYGCDLYIAIHSNKAGSESPRGTECYYYTSYSQPLAEALTNHVSSYFTNNVYYDGADCNRGAQYSYMWTTKQQDFPSVLIEMGFVSNYEDAMALADDSHQEGIAQAILDGIKEYISRSGISSY